MTEPAKITPRPSSAARLLHTSDWHLGVTVRGVSRAHDHSLVIDEIVEIAQRAQPDLILHTGDLFDGHRPAMSEFGRAIHALRALATVAPVVLIAGNHDARVVLEVLQSALNVDHREAVATERFSPTDRRITVLARPVSPANGAVMTFASTSGVDIRLCALPFVHANRVLDEFDELTSPNVAYADNLAKLVSIISSDGLSTFDPSSQVAVFASHLHLAGAFTSSERPMHVSTNYATDTANISASFAYLAFGHIHVPQAIAKGRGRYAGSVLEVDFGEEGEQKSVVVVDLEPGRPAQHQLIPLVSPRRLRRFVGSMTDLHAQAHEFVNTVCDITIIATTAETPEELIDDSPASLSTHIKSLLTDAEIVSITDARRVPVSHKAHSTERHEHPAITLSDAFGTWLSSRGSTLLKKHPKSDATHVQSLFDQLLDVAMGDEAPSTRQTTELARALAQLQPHELQGEQ